MQQILIKVIRSTQYFMDIPSYKCDEVLLIMEEMLDTLKDQDPTVDAYDKLTKKINLGFQNDFKIFGDLQPGGFLTLEARQYDARGG